MLRESRSIVTISRMVGNELKCRGFSTNNTVIRIMTDRVMEMPRKKSSRKVGRGRIKTTRMAIMPIAKKILSIPGQPTLALL